MSVVIQVSCWALCVACVAVGLAEAIKRLRGGPLHAWTLATVVTACAVGAPRVDAVHWSVQLGVLAAVHFALLLVAARHYLRSPSPLRFAGLLAAAAFTFVFAALLSGSAVGYVG
jgi:hypothetical protein